MKTKMKIEKGRKIKKNIREIKDYSVLSMHQHFMAQKLLYRVGRRNR